MTAARRIGTAAAMLALTAAMIACTPPGTPAPTPTPGSLTSTAGLSTELSGTAAPEVDPVANCAGPLTVPDLTGLPVVTPTQPARIVEPSGATYTVTVGLDEESQHPDLPPDSPDEVLMFPVAISVTDGTLAHADAFAFQVYDSETALNCVLGEDPIGYTPILATELGAGSTVDGWMGFKVPKAASAFTVVYFVGGVAAAAWR